MVAGRLGREHHRHGEVPRPDVEGRRLHLRSSRRSPDCRPRISPHAQPRTARRVRAPGPSECTSCTAGNFVSGGSCVTCSQCPTGKYASGGCTGATDTVCAACDPSCDVCSGPALEQCGTCQSGFYANGATCSACTVCAPGSSTTTACSTTANTICAACAESTFASTTMRRLAPCARQGPTPLPAPSCTSCGNCDDGDACTTDACSRTMGCTHAPVVGCGFAESGTTDAGTVRSAQTASAPKKNGDSGSAIRSVPGSSSPLSALASASAIASLLLCSPSAHALERALRSQSVALALRTRLAPEAGVVKRASTRSSAR